MGEFSPIHWLVVLAAILILFGPKKLPEIGKGLGDAIREFKKAMNGPSTGNEPADKDAHAKIVDAVIEPKK